MAEPALPEAPETVGLPPSLRLLKGLVIALTLTMIGGVITVVGLLVTRMPQALSPPAPTLPDGFALPEGAKPAAVTFGKGWILVVTEDDRVLVFGRDGSLRQEMALTTVKDP